jgi:hypothetical protein
MVFGPDGLSQSADRGVLHLEAEVRLQIALRNTSALVRSAGLTDGMRQTWAATFFACCEVKGTESMMRATLVALLLGYLFLWDGHGILLDERGSPRGRPGAVGQ